VRDSDSGASLGMVTKAAPAGPGPGTVQQTVRPSFMCLKGAQLGAKGRSRHLPPSDLAGTMDGSAGCCRHRFPSCRLRRGSCFPSCRLRRGSCAALVAGPGGTRPVPHLPPAGRERRERVGGHQRVGRGGAAGPRQGGQDPGGRRPGRTTTVLELHRIGSIVAARSRGDGRHRQTGSTTQTPAGPREIGVARLMAIVG
jgi:hypothetical protein